MEKYLFRGTLAAGFLLALALIMYNGATSSRMRTRAHELGVQSVDLTIEEID